MSKRRKRTPWQIPIRATTDRYVYRGRRKIHALAFDLVGMPVCHDHASALRALSRSHATSTTTSHGTV